MSEIGPTVVTRLARDAAPMNRGDQILAFRQVAAVVLLLLVSALAGCGSSGGKSIPTVAGIDPNDRDLTRELIELDRQITGLEMWLGTYPPEFASEKERRKVHARWFAAIERATVLLNVDLDNPELFLRAGMLYRQGHFLDIPDAANSAYGSLDRCMTLARDHVECRYELARLLLASSRLYAARAEQLLIEARELIQPAIRPEFEAALAKAYLAQGRRSAALRQIDHYLSLRPGDLEAQRFRSALILETKRDAAVD